VASGKVILDDVVLKVFDETMFPYTEQESAISRLPPGEPSYRLTGEIMAGQEAWAYGALVQLQGQSIPRFHGVYQVCKFFFDGYLLKTNWPPR